MNIKLELISKAITELICNKVYELELDINKIAQTTSILVLEEIKNTLKNDDFSDFEKVEEIVCIFEKYELDCGNCHDFS